MNSSTRRSKRHFQQAILLPLLLSRLADWLAAVDARLAGLRANGAISNWARLFGTPTRFGKMCAQMRNFLDRTGSLWMKGALVGKVGSVFASAATQHGGKETTIGLGSARREVARWHGRRLSGFCRAQFEPSRSWTDIVAKVAANVL